MTSGRIAQHRNYGNIIARHERDAKLKRITRIFTYFVLILIIVLVFFFVRRWERSQGESKSPTSFSSKKEVSPITLVDDLN
jgi:hypothetical protein